MAETWALAFGVLRSFGLGIDGDSGRAELTGENGALGMSGVQAKVVLLSKSGLLRRL